MQGVTGTRVKEDQDHHQTHAHTIPYSSKFDECFLQLYPNKPHGWKATVMGWGLWGEGKGWRMSVGREVGKWVLLLSWDL